VEPIYCPICGELMDMRQGKLICTDTERELSKKTTEWILRSLKNVEPKEPALVDKNTNQSYLCPNCREKLTEYTKFERYFKCNRCNLELKAMSHFNFEELEESHKKEQ
jgi:ribosomal protein L37AE/L43A